ncbi:MAG: CoA ester lyase, partial [Magnetococcales bacterium]|nr:CoA ester lyase [Magnetococcales bacterium]
MRPIRSVLYVPGSNAKLLDKAQRLPADALILDLEDAVAPEAKPLGRQQIHHLLQSPRKTSQQWMVRINDLRSALWQADLEAVLPGGPDALVIPKVESAAELERLSAAIDPSLPLWPMIESPKGVLRAHEIAAHPGVSCLVMGTSDLRRDLHLPSNKNRDGLRLALQQTILAARAEERRILDGVWLYLDDAVGFLRECQEGVELGFDGKTLIHPSQIEPANQTFRPPEEFL